MIYGYCRVSTKGQATDGYSLETQAEEIKSKYDNAMICKETYTGKTMNRPVFDEVMGKMASGDMLVVTKLDRLSRTTTEGIETVRKLFQKGCSVHVLNVGLLEDSPMGQFFLTTLLAVAELERHQIAERMASGKEMARRNPDYKEGRPKKFTKKQLAHAVKLLENNSYKQVEEMTGISKSTLQRAKRFELNKHKNPARRKLSDQEKKEYDQITKDAVQLELDLF